MTSLTTRMTSNTSGANLERIHFAVDLKVGVAVVPGDGEVSEAGHVDVNWLQDELFRLQLST